MAFIKVTDEVREAARGLLIRHNEAEALRAEARFQDELARVESWARGLGRAVNKTRIREEATRELPADKELRKLIEAVAEGKRKQIDAHWWRKVYGDIDRAKLDKIAALADPARNPHEHERAVAKAKLAVLKTRQTPGMPPKPPPLNFVLDARKRKSKTSPPPQSPLRHKLSDSVATPVKPAPAKATPVSDSVATAHVSDSVARLKALNKRRAAQRAAKRANLKCQSCGQPLTAAQRATARYCNATCRSQAWRKIPKETGKRVSE